MVKKLYEANDGLYLDLDDDDLEYLNLDDNDVDSVDDVKEEPVSEPAESENKEDSKPVVTPDENTNKHNSDYTYEDIPETAVYDPTDLISTEPKLRKPVLKVDDDDSNIVKFQIDVQGASLAKSEDIVLLVSTQDAATMRGYWWWLANTDLPFNGKRDQDGNYIVSAHYIDGAGKVNSFGCPLDQKGIIVPMITYTSDFEMDTGFKFIVKDIEFTVLEEGKAILSNGDLGDSEYYKTTKNSKKQVYTYDDSPIKSIIDSWFNSNIGSGIQEASAMDESLLTESYAYRTKLAEAIVQDTDTYLLSDELKQLAAGLIESGKRSPKDICKFIIEQCKLQFKIDDTNNSSILPQLAAVNVYYIEKEHEKVVPIPIATHHIVLRYKNYYYDFGILYLKDYLDGSIKVTKDQVPVKQPVLKSINEVSENISTVTGYAMVAEGV